MLFKKVDLPGEAIKDYWRGKTAGTLYVHSKFGKKTVMAISKYFRTEKQMPVLETKALSNCSGNILEIGAGAGSHALVLQTRKQEITALEISKHSCEVMRERGVKKVICEDFFKFKTNQKFDTLLMMMNGIGFVSTIEGLKIFLDRAKELLEKDGRLIFDSCDVAYVYEEGMGFPKDKYYGQIDFQYEYKNKTTDWFQWLFIDQVTLEMIASEKGWDTEILAEDDKDQYLACLTLKH